jgi:hypothetical protein
MGHFPYKSPLNSCNIYQFAADKVTSNTAVKRNTCRYGNKCEKLWIAVYNQSATVTYTPVRHYNTVSKTHHTSTKAATIITRVLRHTVSVSASNNGLLCRFCHPLNWSPKVKCADKFYPHPDRHKWHHCSWRIPGLFMRPTVGLFVFTAKVMTVSSEKLHACTVSVQADIGPLGSPCCVSYNWHLYNKV